MSCSASRFTTHANTNERIRGYNAFLGDRRNASHDWRMDGKSRMYREGYHLALRLYGQASEESLAEKAKIKAEAKDFKEHCASVKKANSFRKKTSGRLEP